MRFSEPNRQGWRQRWRGIAGIGLVLLLGGGCGGGNSATKNDSVDPSVVQAARALLDTARQPLTFVPPGPSINAASLKGKKVLILSVDQRIPALAATAAAIQEAAGTAGLTASIFDARSDPAKMVQGVQQGVQQANAMILLGIPIALVQSPLQLAQQAKVPTVSVLNNEPKPGEPGQGAGNSVYASIAPSYYKGGQLVASKAILDTGGKANVVIFNTSEITPAKDVVAGMKDVLGKCSTCTVNMNDTPLAQWSTALTGKAQSEIRKDSKVNYLLPIFDNMGIFVTAGIDQANASDKVHCASFNASPAALKLIETGNIFTADPGQPNGWTGWAALDQAMRGMLGQQPGNPEIPIRLFDKSNLGGVNVDDEGALFGNPQYKSGFKKLWGVG
jgi:ribose transport system substrate-binding protein